MNTAGNVKGICVRTLVVMLGVIICGVSVGLFKLVELGADPYTVMNTAISACIGMQFGTLQLLVNIGLFVLVIAFKREFIGFGTIFCMVFLGYTADFVMWLTRDIQEVFTEGMLRFPVLAVSVVLLGLGAAPYASANMGMSPYDCLAYIMEEQTKGKISFQSGRIITDVFSVCAGFLFALMTGIQWKIIGIGTILLAVATGPLIRFFRVRFDKLLAGI